MNEKTIKGKGVKILLIVLIVILYIFSKKENQQKFVDLVLSKLPVNKKLTQEKSIPLNIDISQCESYGRNVVAWGDNTLIKLDVKGQIEWQKKFNTDDMRVYFAEKKIFVYEGFSGTVQVVDLKGEIINKFQVGNGLHNLIEDFNNILAHTKEDGGEIIRILNEKGEVVSKNQFTEQNILTYCINPNNKTYALSVLDTRDALESEILLFGIGNELLWTTSLRDDIALFLGFIDANTLIVLSDRGMYAVSDGNILWKKNLYSVKHINIDKKNIYILYGNSLEVLTFDGRTAEKYILTEEYKKIILSGKYTILYGENGFIGLKDGNEIFKYRTKDPILNILQTKGKILVVYKNKIDIILP